MASNVTTYLQDSINTKKGHKTQTRQWIHSTNPKCNNTTPAPPLEETLPPVTSNEVHIYVEHISTLYTNNMVRLPILYHSGNHYTILAYHYNRNTILVDPFNSKNDRHIADYKSIIIRLKQYGHTVDLQVLEH